MEEEEVEEEKVDEKRTRWFSPFISLLVRLSVWPCLSEALSQYGKKPTVIGGSRHLENTM